MRRFRWAERVRHSPSEARGFGAKGTARTSLYEMHAQARDYFLLALILLLSGAFLYLNVGLGMANQAIALF